MSYLGKATLALINGKVVTVDSENSIREAIAVKGNKILRVGSNNDVKGLIDSKTKVIDLDGKTVLPGFIDSHVHAFGVGRLKVQGRHQVR